MCEALYLALPSSHHLMRISGSIVTPQTLFPGAVSVNATTPARSLSVTTNFGVRPFFLRSSRISRSAAVAQALDQHVEDLAFLIDLCERFYRWETVSAVRDLSHRVSLPALLPPRHLTTLTIPKPLSRRPQFRWR
jgi:hypothetical protein